MEKGQIGQKIRVLRKNKGITQEQLAEILKVSTPAISKWESGQTYPDISLLPIIARYFQVTIDFLFDFSDKLTYEDTKAICNDIVKKFENLKFSYAQKEWENYLRKFPTDYSLRYELATIGIFNLHKASSIEEMYVFANKIIQVFEQCTKSDDLKIKQGGYFQMANLYIMKQDFDKAETVLNKLPMQFANPKFLLSMIFIGKNDLENANKNIQENIYRAAIDIIGELSNMISILTLNENENTDKILDLLNNQKQITNIFGLDPICGAGIRLQISKILAKNKEFEKLENELENVINILEKYPQGVRSINDIPFFKDTDLDIVQNNERFPTHGYNMLVDQIFSLIKGNRDFKSIKSRFEQMLM